MRARRRCCIRTMPACMQKYQQVVDDSHVYRCKHWTITPPNRMRYGDSGAPEPTPSRRPASDATTTPPPGRDLTSHRHRDTLPSSASTSAARSAGERGEGNCIRAAQVSGGWGRDGWQMQPKLAMGTLYSERALAALRRTGARRRWGAATAIAPKRASVRALSCPSARSLAWKTARAERPCAPSNDLVPHVRPCASREK